MGSNIWSLGGGNLRGRAMLPPLPGIEYINFFDGGYEVVDRNLIVGSPTPRVVGDPSYGPGYARFTGMKNFLESYCREHTRWTIASLCRQVGAATGTSRAAIAGNFLANGANAGSMLFVNSDSQMRAAANNALASGAPYAQSSGEVVQDWGFRVSRCRAADIIYDNLTSGQSATQTLGQSARILSPATHRIGSVRSGNLAGVCDISVMILMDRDAANDELPVLLDIARIFGALGGIAA